MNELIFTLAHMILNTCVSVFLGIFLGIFISKAINGEFSTTVMIFGKVVLILLVSLVWVLSVGSDIYLIINGKISSPQTSTWVHLFFGVPVGIINKDYLAKKIENSSLIPEAFKSKKK